MDFINQTIGKYKLVRKIGEGGMAYVYEGIHEKLGTRAAVKILNPVLSVNQQIRIRFENEVKLLASLDHPNIIRVIDYDESPGRLAIIMDYLTGSDLSTILKTRGAFSPENVKDIFRQIMSAFQYAHEQGIVHRDIKPSNIFITEKGQVKILDFGIAKIFGTGDDMTSTGAQIGTLIYMSPEQVKGDKSIDHRSDIYSLGVTLYSMLKGKPPYNPSVSSHYEISHQIVTEPLPLLDIDPAFAGFIEKAVEKDRNMRYQSVEEMMEEFGNVSSSTFELNQSAQLKVNATNNSKQQKRSGVSYLFYAGIIIIILGSWTKILHMSYADHLLIVGGLIIFLACIFHVHFKMISKNLQWVSNPKSDALSNNNKSGQSLAKQNLKWILIAITALMIIGGGITVYEFLQEEYEVTVPIDLVKVYTLEELKSKNQAELEELADKKVQVVNVMNYQKIKIDDNTYLELVIENDKLVKTYNTPIISKPSQPDTDPITTKPTTPSDKDKDGIVDAQDKCPDDPTNSCVTKPSQVLKVPPDVKSLGNGLFALQTTQSGEMFVSFYQRISNRADIIALGGGKDLCTPLEIKMKNNFEYPVDDFVINGGRWVKFYFK